MRSGVLVSLHPLRADQPEFSRRLPATPRPDARFRLVRAFNHASAGTLFAENHLGAE